MTNNQDFYNRITIFDTFLQMLSLVAISEDASNNELMDALQEQNEKYLKQIVDQQNEILKYLRQE